MGYNNRPVGQKDTNGHIIPASYGDLAFQGEYSGDNLIYRGLARPGSPTDEAFWQIALLTYTGSNLTSITWPLNDQGVPSSNYEFVWDDRASYTYA